jgi:predicted AAA+ superfamily ATPase
MQYIKRQLTKELRILIKEFPIVAIMGPRQSGKTTLIKNLFPTYTYVSLEDLSMRSLAQNDPQSFLERFSSKTIIDEVQYAPNLFPYLQLKTDEKNAPGQYIITGSQNYLLLKKVSQSLAGRVGIAKLLPFSYQEIADKLEKFSTAKIMLTGFYPRIFAENIRPTPFYESYLTTYIEKDVLTVFNIKHLDKFRGFLKLLASRSGQILNISSLSADLEVSRSVLNKWLNILEASFIIFRVPSFFKNYKKQVIKAGKIFFYDTGLLCYLLGIRDTRQLEDSYLIGNIFENLVFIEMLKNSFNAGVDNKLYYWRDNKGREIDLVMQSGLKNYGFEIKKSKMIRNDFFKNLTFWQELDKNNTGNLIYDGEKSYSLKGIKIINWRKLKKF